MARIGTLVVATAVVGFLVGVRAVGGTLPAPELDRTGAVREAGPFGGGFWRPAGSNAVRPRIDLEARTWQPAR